MEPFVLTVYKCPFDKMRLGRDGDGGYVFANIPGVQYTTLLGGGISDDSSFEEDFLKMFPLAKVYAVDGSIANLDKPGITFIKKMVGAVNTQSATNLHHLINNGTFVKMDIEGGEVGWIKSLNDDHLNQIEQIVIEFHYPFSNNEVGMFDKLNKHHVLVHLHGNNCCGVRTHNGVVVPNIFESTYLHKKYFTKKEFNTESIPGKLDMRNTSKPEIFIDHPPFVTKPAKKISQRAKIMSNFDALSSQGSRPKCIARRRVWFKIT